MSSKQSAQVLRTAASAYTHGVVSLLQTLPSPSESIRHRLRVQLYPAKAGVPTAEVWLAWGLIRLSARVNGLNLAVSCAFHTPRVQTYLQLRNAVQMDCGGRHQRSRSAQRLPSWPRAR